MSIQEQLSELKRLISVMESNHFLLPDSFSDRIEMTFEDFDYKTYVGGRGDQRYITFHIYEDGKKELEIHFRNNSITTDEDISKRISVSKLLNYIQLIYKEKHSFENHATGVKDFKKKIRTERDRIKSANKEIETLKNQIKGIQELQNK